MSKAEARRGPTGGAAQRGAAADGVGSGGGLLAPLACRNYCEPPRKIAATSNRASEIRAGTVRLLLTQNNGAKGHGRITVSTPPAV